MNGDPADLEPDAFPKPIFALFAIAVIAICVLVIVCMMMGCGDGDDDHVTVLPVVDDCLPNSDRRVTCRDWNGEKPDHTVSRIKAENSPHFCFVGDVCFYGCPR